MNTLYVMFNQRHFENMGINFEIFDGRVTGWINVEGQNHRLEDITGVYVRLMDDRFLPEIKKEPQDSAKRSYCRMLHDTLIQWCEIAPTRIVNRPLSMGSNSSKPYQAQLIVQYGFNIPETLITNDPITARQFTRQHKRTIYKSISGVRSIVQTLNDKDLDRLEYIRWCPVQFQEFVEGLNVRVHVIGNSIFATSLATDATDYRYAHRQGYDDIDMKAVTLPDDLAQRCVELSHGLGLAFAGIDLKITSDNKAYCFEVNPSPAFNYYESGTGQQIALAVAQYLQGEEI